MSTHPGLLKIIEILKVDKCFDVRRPFDEL
jgi:hypothetical protein